MSKVDIGRDLAIQRCKTNLSQLMALIYMSEGLSKQDSEVLERLVLSLSYDIDGLAEGVNGKRN